MEHRVAPGFPKREFNELILYHATWIAEFGFSPVAQLNFDAKSYTELIRVLAIL